MLDKEHFELKNQIKELYDMCNSINVSFSELKRELMELSKTITDFNLPKLDIKAIDFNGDLV